MHQTNLWMNAVLVHFQSLNYETVHLLWALMVHDSRFPFHTSRMHREFGKNHDTDETCEWGSLPDSLPWFTLKLRYWEQMEVNLPENSYLTQRTWHLLNRRFRNSSLFGLLNMDCNRIFYLPFTSKTWSLPSSKGTKESNRPKNTIKEMVSL